MNKLVALLALLLPSIAVGSYPHGYKLTHDDSGKAYVGYYYTWDAYRCKWNQHYYPKAGSVSHSLDNHSINYSYTYNYLNASANAGASQGGLQGAFRYDEYSPGRDEVDSQHYVASARSIDERRLDNQRVRDVQAGYTQDKVLEIQKLEAKERILKSLDGGSSQPAPLLQQFNSYSAPKEPVVSTKVVSPANLGAIETKCARCHSAATSTSMGNGNTLPSFAEFTAAQAESALDYITRLDPADNCAVKAQLSQAEHQELRRFLCKKAQ